METLRVRPGVIFDFDWRRKELRRTLKILNMKFVSCLSFMVSR